MPEEVRIWQVLRGDKLKEINRAKLNLEERIEEWLVKDIALLSDELLLIGRQVQTEYAGPIDLLCMDRDANLVIVELKRDKTPREVTAQVLDYASWVNDLSNEVVRSIAGEFLGGSDKLEEGFRNKFGHELPEIINEQHRMLIVGSELDSSSERIVKYLSECHGIAINAATFQFFRKGNDEEILARVFLVPPSVVEENTRTKGTSKRAANLTYQQLQDLADRNGVGDLYRELKEGLEPLFDRAGTTRSSLAFIAKMDESAKVMFSLFPEESEPEKGLHFEAYSKRMAKHFGVDEKRVLRMLPENKQGGIPWKGALLEQYVYAGFFTKRAEIGRLVVGLKEAKQRQV